MKILYILQQSVYTNDGQWVTADSNIQMMRGVIKELLIKTDWTFDILIAPINDFYDIDSYNEILPESDRIKWIGRPTSINAFTNRYNFNVGFFENLLNYKKYDVVWNNIIELSRNIKTIIHINKLKTKLISCNYWIDCPTIGEGKVDTAISYDFRQIDGAECSDLVPFTCKSTKDAFLDNTYLRSNLSTVDKIKNKSTIWDFGFDHNELLKYRTNEKFDKTTILFPNRLSGINYTHHEEFIEAVNSLYQKRQDFQVIFANPSLKVPFDKLEKEVKPLFMYNDDVLDREEYIKLLWMSDIIISLYTIERYGGCSNVEGIFCGCVPIMTDFGEYINRSCPPYIYVEKDMSNLEEIINYYLNNYKTSFIQGSLQKMREYVCNNSSYKVVAKRVIDDINSLFK